MHAWWPGGGRRAGGGSRNGGGDGEEGEGAEMSSAAGGRWGRLHALQIACVPVLLTVVWGRWRRWRAHITLSLQEVNFKKCPPHAAAAASAMPSPTSPPTPLPTPASSLALAMACCGLPSRPAGHPARHVRAARHHPAAGPAAARVPARRGDDRGESYGCTVPYSRTAIQHTRIETAVDDGGGIGRSCTEDGDRGGDGRQVGSHVLPMLPGAHCVDAPAQCGCTHTHTHASAHARVRHLHPSSSFSSRPLPCTQAPALTPLPAPEPPPPTPAWRRGHGPAGVLTMCAGVRGPGQGRGR